jgi:uncharacterized delta-60 repeat protein
MKMRAQIGGEMRFGRLIKIATTAGLICAVAIAGQASAGGGNAGDLDDSFSGDGKKVANIQAHDRAEDVVVLPGGKILVLGSSDSFSNFALARFRPNGGSLDRTFGPDGRKLIDFGGSDTAAAMALQDDGKVIAVGTAQQTDSDIALTRVKPTGRLDKAFGGDGKVTTDFGQDEGGSAISILPSGKILVAGFTYDGASEADFVVARYNRNGKLDTNSDSNPSSSFSQDGWRRIDFPVAVDQDYAYAMVVRNRKITVVGKTQTVSPISGDFGFARLRLGGALDDSFDNDGLATVDFEGDSDVANDAKVLASGKTIAVGEATVGGQSRFAFARLTETGTPDGAFSGDGERSLLFDGGADEAVGNALEVQSDGKYVGVGQSISDDRFALVRLRKTGLRDRRFGDAGEVETKIDGSSQAWGATVDADGRIVAVGEATREVNGNFALARYLTS